MKMRNKYWEISSREIINFYNSLKNEKETFKLSLEQLLNSKIIIKEESYGKIAGIAGIRRAKILPVLFIVVKSEFQGIGLGKRLMKRLHEISKRKCIFITLSVLKKNKRAINLFKKFEYEIFLEKEEFYYMIHSYRFVGKIIARAQQTEVIK